MVASLLMIQTDSAVFDFPSTTFEYNDGALVNKWWRITWKSVKLNVLILVVETIGPYLLSIFVNRICTLMWMLSLIMKVIRCLYLFQPRERGRLRFHMLQNVQIALDFLRYRKVSHTTLLLTCDIGRWARLYIALDFLRYRKVSQTTLLLTCDTGRWATLYIALDFLRYSKVSQILHCSWLAIQEGEPDCILLLTSCDAGRWVRLHCSWLAIQEGESDYNALDLRYRKVSQTVYYSWLLAIQEGESDYNALDLRYRKVRQTVYCSWLLAIQEGESDYIALDLRYRKVSQTTLLLTCDSGRWARLYCSWPAIQNGESDSTLLLTSCDAGRWVTLHCSWLLAIQDGESDYIALDLRYRKVSQTVHCSWLLVLQAGESDCRLILTSCDTGRWVTFNIFKKVTCPLSVLEKWMIC